MMTRVVGKTKAYPRPEQDMMSGIPNNCYFTWQEAWGPKPTDADDYFYIVWVVDYGRPSNKKTTQPFDIELGYVESENTFQIGDQTFTPKMVGSVSSGDGTAGVGHYNANFYANKWADVATSSENKGRLAYSEYNVLGYDNTTGFPRVGFSVNKQNGTYAGICEDTRFSVLMRYPTGPSTPRVRGASTW